VITPPHILVVEDDSAYIEAITNRVGKLCHKTTVTVASSRDTAISHLAKSFFDLIILDLKIPTLDGKPDADVKHGHAVFAKSLELAPGIITLVLTGSPAEDFIPAMLERAQRADVWGEGRKIQTVDFLPKYRFDTFPDKLTPIVESISSLGDIEIARESSLVLTTPQDRIIRIFTRRRAGTKCAISRITSGLSGAEVFRLRITDISGALRDLAIAKVGTQEQIREETDRFDRHVSRLEPAATPRKLSVLEFGAKDLAGIFYSLADGFDRSAFDLINESLVVNRIEALTKKWRDGVGESRVSGQTLRKRLLDDASFDHVISTYGVSWARELDDRQLQVRWCCVHGDLHGLNILVDRETKCLLIDYGDVAEGPASLDPTTLEFSILCHKSGPLTNSSWPQPERALEWATLDNYLQDCPCPEFIRECRAWATRVAAGDRERAFTACFYLLRQLKYEDTNKARILSLLAGVKSLLDGT